MEIFRKKNEATVIAFPMINTATPDAFDTGETVTDTAYYSDAGGAWTSLAITDTVAEIGTTGMYELSLTAGEMNHDNIIIKFTSTNAADTAVVIRTRAVDEDDLVRATTPANTLDIDASGNVNADLIAAQSNTVTFPALTITGLLDINDGIDISATTTNRNGITSAGNGTGHGIAAVAGATNGNGFYGLGLGSGNGMSLDGGSAGGAGLAAIGGAGGHGVATVGGSDGSGFWTFGVGTGSGIFAQGGTTTGAVAHGIEAVAAAGSDGHGLFIQGDDTGHGFFADGGANGNGGRIEGGGGVLSYGLRITNPGGSLPTLAIEAGGAEAVNVTGEFQVDGLVDINDGVNISATTLDRHGLVSSGNGSGEGIRGEGGTTGHGILGVTSGAGVGGIVGLSTVNGAGIIGQGGGANAGIRGIGGGTLPGHGIEGIGGALGGDGLRGTGTVDGDGFQGIGSGLGSGIEASGGIGGTGHGLELNTDGGQALFIDGTVLSNNTIDITGTITNGTTNISATAVKLALSTAGIISGAATGTPTTASMQTDLTGYLDNELNGAAIIFTGGIAAGQRTFIDAYATTNGVITFRDTLATAPVAADQFVIV
ncbi:MAG: hypothetical protein OEQ39_00125 [Gammaproteobacteria bacterium]|nr:hypothetical protein [Gammaproteobacteria bacterium]